MTVICTKCGALSVHQCQCLNPVTLTGHQAPLPPTDPAKPELPVWVITCDRCGTTYKNNERHACAASEPAKQERQACDYCDCGYKPENCKGCGPEPARPERQASEIEKRAAVALLENCKSSIVERVDSGFNASLRISCEWYIEAYDYAKSIGAI